MKRPPRHCMIVHNYYPIGEPRVQRQAEALVQAGYEVDVICLRDQGEASQAEAGGVRIYRLPVRRDKRRGTAGQMLEYLAFFTAAMVWVTGLHLRRGYAAVEVHNLPDFLVFAALVPRALGARVILNLHDLMPEFFISRFGGDQRRLPVRLVRWQEKLSCWFADRVITVTHLWRNTLIERGVPARKVSVVMNVADDRIFRPRPPAPPEAGPLRLIYHGTLTYRYGVDLVIRAAALAQARVPGLTLIVHGRGEYLPELQRLAGELGLDGVVTFSTRLLPMEELPGLLASADAGLVPYRRDPFTDGILPTKLMEYAAVGLPAIAARTPAIQAYFPDGALETVEAEDVGALAECIVRLHEDRAHLARLAHSIRQFNTQYNWAAQRAEYLALVAGLQRTPRSAPTPGSLSLPEAE